MTLQGKDIGLAVGSFLGDRGNTYAAGLSAGVYTKTLKLRNSVLDALHKAGGKVGIVMGEPALEALASGARETGPTARNKFESRFLGVNVGYLAAAILAVFILWTLFNSR